MDPKVKKALEWLADRAPYSSIGGDCVRRIAKAGLGDGDLDAEIKDAEATIKRALEPPGPPQSLDRAYSMWGGGGGRGR